MVNPSVIALRKTLMEAHPLVTYNKVTSTGQTLTALSSSTGYDVESLEKYLGLLIDDALVTRTIGMRSVATYQLA